MVWDGYMSIKIIQSPFVNDGSIVEYTHFGNIEEIWLGMTCLHEIEKEPELKKI